MLEKWSLLILQPSKESITKSFGGRLGFTYPGGRAHPITLKDRFPVGEIYSSALVVLVSADTS